LSTFFTQWLEQGGAPGLHIKHASVSGSPDGGFDVTLTLRQDAPVYQLTVPVIIATARGSEQRTIVLDDRQATTSWRFNDRPDLLAVDPDHRLLLKLATEDLPPILRDVTLSDQALVLIATEEPAFETRARALADKLVQSVAGEVDLGAARRSQRPLLIIGDDLSLPAVLETLGLAMPAELRLEGATLRAWVVRRTGGAAVLTISARDQRSLEAASGPLGYYGRRGYVAFADRKALVSGEWRPTDGSLVWRFD
jgi:hypothetical protein